MSVQRIELKQRGYLIVNSHPGGCDASVRELWRAIPPGPERELAGRAPVAVVLGASAGYGMAILLTGLKRHGIRGIGVAYENGGNERRTATAGWYRTAAMAELDAAGDLAFLNADAYADETRAQVLKLLAERFGPVDYLVYSLASPRRTDPATGEVHHSVIKPLGAPYTSPSLVFEDGSPRLGTVELPAATEAERAATVKVMGGEDWETWVRALADANLLGEGFTTVALSYVGSEITAPVYRQGTIGAAKEHLEGTAHHLQADVLRGRGRAYTVVAGAAVTQASTAIPSLALYTSLLRDVLGPGGWRTTADQALHLWEQLVNTSPLELDDQGRIRLDGWELDPEVQERVRAVWADPPAALAAEPSSGGGPAWFYEQVRQLYGWDVPGVDYAAAVETAVDWPAPRL